MAENIVELLTDVADAIREKKGSNEPINAQNFADEIKNLPSGGDNGLADSLVMRTITEYVNDEITEIGDNAFNGCTKLTTIVVNKVTKIGGLAVANSRNLATLNAPSLERINTQALRDNKLTHLDLPALVNIASYALYGNTLLTTLILSKGAVCGLESTNALTNTPIANGTGYIYVPDDLVDAYKEATNWSTYASQIKGLSELPNE